MGGKRVYLRDAVKIPTVNHENLFPDPNQRSRPFVRPSGQTLFIGGEKNHPPNGPRKGERPLPRAELLLKKSPFSEAVP